MPRSAADATRFTATGPHAHSKPSRPSLSSSPSGSISSAAQAHPNGETPQQKVARLRAAAVRAKMQEVSAFERVVTRGRSVADRAHRFVALGLIGMTGVFSVVAVYALGDMVLYNRQKRKVFYEEQKVILNKAVEDAKAALVDDTASEAQIALLQREKAKEEWEAKQKAKKGALRRGKDWLMGGLKNDDSQEDDSSVPTLPSVESIKSENGVLKAVEEHKKSEELRIKQAIQERGGMLDRLGTAPSDGSKGGWTNWLIGR